MATDTLSDDNDDSDRFGNKAEDMAHTPCRNVQDVAVRDRHFGESTPEAHVSGSCSRPHSSISCTASRSTACSGSTVTGGLRVGVFDPIAYSATLGQFRTSFIRA